MKLYSLILILLSSLKLFGDTVRFSAVVLDDISGKPLVNVDVGAGFTMDAGPVWENRFKYDHKQFLTDANGVCNISGKSNCGKAGCYIKYPLKGYYKPCHGCSLRFEKKSLFGVWQPDNLVVTLRLDRVEKPIPLFVKRATLRNYHKGIGGFDGTNSIVRFDILKGDWLPPYGKGETADLEFKSTLVIKDRAWFMIEPRKYDWVYFYNLGTNVKCLGEKDGFDTVCPRHCAGIKIRRADGDCVTRSLALANIGRNKKYHRNGEDWDCQNYKDHFSDRAVLFRIRSRYDEKGNLKEAYYGKIYGDFEIEGNDKKGLIGISFLYYLNPSPLDRNLEWDMKTNLCPNPGAVNRKEP